MSLPLFHSETCHVELLIDWYRADSGDDKQSNWLRQAPREADDRTERLGNHADSGRQRNGARSGNGTSQSKGDARGNGKASGYGSRHEQTVYKQRGYSSRLSHGLDDVDSPEERDWRTEAIDARAELEVLSEQCDHAEHELELRAGLLDKSEAARRQLEKQLMQTKAEAAAALDRSDAALTQQTDKYARSVSVSVVWSCMSLCEPVSLRTCHSGSLIFNLDLCALHPVCSSSPCTGLR